MMFSKTGWLLGAALALATLSPLAAAQTKVDRVIAADVSGTVSITNVAGAIAVNGWDRAEVRATGTLGKGVERLDFTRQGSRVVIKVILKRGNLPKGDGTATLQISLPRASRLEVSSVSADVTADGISGTQKISTVSGDLVAEIGKGGAELQSVSGDAKLRGGAEGAKLRASTVSGDLMLRDGAGDIEIQTVSGDINAQLRQMRSGRVRTTSGDLELEAALPSTATLDVETVSGDVEITARAAGGMSIDAQSFSGEISTCFGREGEPTSKYGPGKRLSMQTVEGGANLRIKTLSGDVSVCDR